MEFPDLDQKEHTKPLEQAIYLKMVIFQVDSGYDPNSGIVADRNKITALTIAANTQQEVNAMWAYGVARFIVVRD